MSLYGMMRIMKEMDEIKADIKRLTSDAFLYELAAEVAWDLDPIFKTNTQVGRETIRKALRNAIDNRTD